MKALESCVTVVQFAAVNVNTLEILFSGDGVTTNRAIIQKCRIMWKSTALINCSALIVVHRNNKESKQSMEDGQC